MASVINTNIASLNAQRNLSMSQSALSTSIQRLSSGLRINSAKDDAAGLAIATRMSSQINGLNVAARNANDGISLSQTAEGDLGTITNNLQRIRDLAVQSANATNSSTDRAALNSEATQLKAEIDRVAGASSFNNVKLLDGSFKGANAVFQVGANAGQTIAMSDIGAATSAALGTWTSSTTPAVAGSYTSNQVTAFDFSTPATTFAGGSAAETVVPGAAGANINFSAGGVGSATFTVDGTHAVTLSANYSADTNSANIASAIQAQLGAGYTVTQTGGATGFGISIVNNTSPTAVSVSGANAVANTAGLANTAGTAGTTASAGTQAGFSVDGHAVSLTANDTNLSGLVTDIQNQLNAAVANTYTVTAGSNGGIKITSNTAGAATPVSIGSYTGQGFADFGGGTAVAGADATTGTAQTGFASLDLTTVDGANNAILAMDAALTSVNSTRADLGAIQNRFSSVVTNVQTTSENLSAAKSRIMDTDFAAETANMTRGNILQQAGTAMLAQANQLPNMVLSLLK